MPSGGSISSYVGGLPPSIEPPLPPEPPSASNYAIPGGATVVSTAADFQTHFTGSGAKDIRVTAGSYSRPAYLTAGAGHRVWCEAGVTFDFGLQFRDRTGGEVHGGTFDITTTAQMADDGNGRYAGIANWISASTQANFNLQVTDATINLHGLGKYGVFFGRPGGAIAKRLHITGAADAAVWAYNNGPSSVAGWLAATVTIDEISDIDAVDIFASPRGIENGEAEYAIIIGHPVLNGVSRIRARNCGWAGMLILGKVADTIFEDLDADECWGYIPPITALPTDWGKLTGQGLYLERTVRGYVFRRCRFGGSAGDLQRGIACEWDENGNYRLTAPFTVGVSTSMQLDYGNFLTTGSVPLPASGTVYIDEVAQTPVAFTVDDAGRTAKTLTTTAGAAGATWPSGTFVSTWPGGRQALTDCEFEDIYVNANTARGSAEGPVEDVGLARPRRGITMDQGSMRPILRRVHVAGCDTYGIVDSTGVPHATTIGASNATYEDITFDLNSGAVEIGHP
jgi:hypothetical protein